MSTQHTSTDLRIVMAQLNFMVGDIHSNTDRIIAASIRARDKLAADAIVFPELAITGYPPEDLLLRVHFIERVEEAVERICREVRGITVITGYPLEEAGDLYNAAGKLWKRIRSGPTEHMDGKMATWIDNIIIGIDSKEENRFFESA